MQTMTLGDHLIQGLADGRLNAAIWHGRHDLGTGPVRLRSPDGSVSVEMTITEVRHKPFTDLDDREARDSGEADHHALWQVMSAAYGDMSQADEVTVAFIE